MEQNGNKNNAPPPGEVPKNLHPLYGTRCRTECYAVKPPPKKGMQAVYMEAFLDDPVAKTWTVCKVTRQPQSLFPFGSITRTDVHKVRAGVSFNDALNTLAEFDKTCRAMPEELAPELPDAEKLGFTHYRAFAEREGYVFDLLGKPLARPVAGALPAGVFGDEDIARADRHVQRPADEFDNSGPASKTPVQNTHFLLDQFTAATHHRSLDDSLKEIRMLKVLDRFVDQLGAAHDLLLEYCNTYAQTGKGGLIYDAEEALTRAESLLKQLGTYGAETKGFDNFLLQCRTTCYVLHAEGLYDLMQKGLGDFDDNEKLFKERVKQAIDAFSRIDNSDAGIRTLQDMIVQSPKPEVPRAITTFLDNYERQRDSFTRKQQLPPRQQPPKQPRP